MTGEWGGGRVGGGRGEHSLSNFNDHFDQDCTQLPFAGEETAGNSVDYLNNDCKGDKPKAGLRMNILHILRPCFWGVVRLCQGNTIKPYRSVAPLIHFITLFHILL